MKKNKLESKKITEVIPIAEFGKDSILLSDGSIAFGYKIQLPEEGTINQDEYASRIGSLQRTFSVLPLNTVIQNFDVFYYRQYLENKDILNKDFDEKDFFVRKKYEHYHGRPILKQENYIFINFRKKDNKTGANVKQTLLANPPIHYGKPKELISKKEAFESLLENDFPFEPLSGENALNLMYRYINVDFENQPICFNSLCLDKGKLQSGIQYIGVISMDSQAPYVTTFKYNQVGVATSFLKSIYNDSRFPHVVSKSFRIENSKKMIENIISTSQRAMELFFRKSTEREAQRLEDEALRLEETLAASGGALVSNSMHVITWDSQESTLKEKLLSLQKAFTNANIASNIESYSAPNLFIGSAPACGGQLFRGKPMPLETAIAYSCFTSPRKGSKEGIILSDRNGYPLKYNPFNYNLDNQNAFIFGPSGSGKSFTNGKMIKDRFEDGHTLIIIDSGATYRRLFEALGGKFIEYNSEKSLNLNPFLVSKANRKRDQYNIDATKIDFLTAFIGKIWKGDLAKKPMSEAEKSLLAQYIVDYYNQVGKGIPSLRNFTDWLLKTPKKKEERKLFNFTEFEIVLQPFTKGIYKDHFNSENLDYLPQERLICFELGAVKSNPKLYPLLIQVLFDYAFEIVSSKPEAIKFIDVEEGWAMLDDIGEEYIEALFRKGRKTRTSIRLITQDIEEVKNSRIAGALKNNASTFILLYNEKESSRKEAGKWLGLSDHEMQKYASLQRRGGKNPYREILIKEMKKSSVFRVEASPSEYALLTSRPDERDAISRLQLTMPVQDAVTEWVKRRNQKLQTQNL